MSYLAPNTMAEAFAALARPEVAVIAGGTDWFPQAGDRLTGVSLLDVNGLPGFRGITRTADGWRIGAATTWSDIAAAILPPCFDGLKAAARQVGAVQIQNAATIAGNLCNASPAADGVPPLLTLDAQVELVSQAGRRVLPLSEFITGVRTTARHPHELMAAVLIPAAADGARSGFMKLGARRYMVISIAMVAALIRAEAGVIAEARIAAGACSPVAQRLPQLESALIGRRLAERTPPVDPVWLAGLTPVSDLRGSAGYRSEAVAQMIGRVLTDLTDQPEQADG